MIHSTAIIDPSAKIDPSTEVGAYSIIGSEVQIGENCLVEPHSQICNKVTIGKGNKIGRGSIIGADPQDLSFDPSIISKVSIGDDNTIRELVTIHRSTELEGITKIGNGNFLMTGCHIGHDVTVGNNIIIANSCLLGGHTVVNDNAFLGGGAVFHQFVHIGSFCMIQGNSTITKDVPTYCIGYGRNCLAGINTIGLKRSGMDKKHIQEIKNLFKVIFYSKDTASSKIKEEGQKKNSEHIDLFLESLSNPSQKGICHPSQK